jgi:hypothetical protein
MGLIRRSYVATKRELLRLLGTPLIMDELYTLDYATLSSDPLNTISPVQALIFLFKWTADREGDDVGEGGARGPKTGGVYDPEFAERGGFYAKQVRSSNPLGSNY